MTKMKTFFNGDIKKDSGFVISVSLLFHRLYQWYLSLTTPMSEFKNSNGVQS